MKSHEPWFKSSRTALNKRPGCVFDFYFAHICFADADFGLIVIIINAYGYSNNTTILLFAFWPTGQCHCATVRCRRGGLKKPCRAPSFTFKEASNLNHGLLNDIIT